MNTETPERVLRYRNAQELQTVVDRLGEIVVPTLVMSGRYDEATPTVAETVHKGIPGSEWVFFENSSHMCRAMLKSAIVA